MEPVIQQGDVELRRIAAIPADAKPVAPTARGYVLAEGEVTGHAHTIAPDKARVFRLGEKLFVEVTDPVDLVHQTHDVRHVPPGFYEAGVVREYDYFAEEARRVAD